MQLYYPGHEDARDLEQAPGSREVQEVEEVEEAQRPTGARGHQHCGVIF